MSEEDIDFLMSIQGLEQPEFDNAYLERENKKLEKEIERLNNIIEQTQKILYIKLMNENKEKIYIQEVMDIIENLKGSESNE